MATAYTDLLGLALPVTGELSGTWGDEVSNYITKFLDSAVAGTQVISGSQTAVTLTKTTGSNLAQVGSGSSGSSQYAVIRCTGNPAGTLTITVPAASKVYAVVNATTTAQSVKLVGVGPTTGVTVASGKTAVVVWNGSDFVEVAPATATTATNLAGGAAGSLPYQSGAGATTFLSIGTNNFVLTSNGTAPVWTTNTGTGNVVRATSPTLVTPTFTTSATGPLFIGGTGTTSTLTLRSTSGVGTTGADIIFQTGNNGATEAMRVLNNGNVGIGTSSPSQKLQAIGAIESTHSNLYRGIRLEAGGGNQQTLKAINYLGAPYTADLAFNTDNGGVDSEKMRILGNGNVGIGTSSPAQLLHVVGTSTKALVATSSSSGFASVQAQSDGGTNDLEIVQYGTAAAGTYFSVNRAGACFLGASATSFGLGTKGATPMLFATNNTERVRIDSSGKVGIGSLPSTDALLNVSGNVKIGDTYSLFMGFQSEQRILAAGSSNSTYLTFSQWISSGYVERVRIDPNGNLGIGTASPVNKLDVVGSFGRGAPVTKTGNFTLAATENWVICNGTGTITVTLPAASSWTGREVMIKTIAAQTVVSASSNVVPLAGSAAGTAILAATAGRWATLVSDGTNWVIMSAA